MRRRAPSFKTGHALEFMQYVDSEIERYCSVIGKDDDPPEEDDDVPDLIATELTPSEKNRRFYVDAHDFMFAQCWARRGIPEPEKKHTYQMVVTGKETYVDEDDYVRQRDTVGWEKVDSQEYESYLELKASCVALGYRFAGLVASTDTEASCALDATLACEEDDQSTCLVKETRKCPHPPDAELVEASAAFTNAAFKFFSSGDADEKVRVGGFVVGKKQGPSPEEIWQREVFPFVGSSSLGTLDQR